MTTVTKVISTRAEFWELTDSSKLSEQYRINTNLRYLARAPLSVVQAILVQYRYFTHYYINDLAMLIHKLPFSPIRSVLGDILAEELGSGNWQLAHPQLYDNFLASIGIPLSSLATPNAKCINSLQSISSLVVHHSWAYGLGLRGMGGECICQLYLTILYDYLIQNPAIISCREQIAWKFWEIHIGEVDIRHQELMRSAIDNIMLEDDACIGEISAGYLYSKLAWDQFWDEIFNAATTASYSSLTQEEADEKVN